MGFFSKKKKGAETPEVESPVVADKVKRGNKSRKGELMKVLNESVWESVHEDFKANKQFIIDQDGQTKYVALLFDTNQIGGLASREAKKDESKGSIIEAIHTGHIKTYVRAEMLQDDCFVIIPDGDTIEAMQEFSLLAEAEYILCTVTPDGVITTETMRGTDAEDDPEVMIPFSKLKNVVLNGVNVMTLFPNRETPVNDEFAESAFDGALAEQGMSAGGAMVSGPDDDPEVLEFGEGGEEPPDDLEDGEEPVSEKPLSDEEKAEPAGDGEDEADDLSDVEDIPDEAPAAEGKDAPQQPTQPEEADGDFGLTAEDFGFNPDGSGLPPEEADEGGYDTFADVTEDMVKDFVTRKFYSDELGLEVSTEPFDAQFLHGNPYLPFNENRGTGWLNEYLANIAKDANTRMMRLHSENLFRMRERYMRVMAANCERIAEALDITSDKTQYGKLRFAIERSMEENLDSISGTVAEKRQQLEDAWARELDQVAETAAAQARQEHMLRYGRTHEADLQKLETLERDEVQRDFQNSMTRMKNDRRAEAAKMLDMAINDTLQEMASIYLRVLEEEKREYVRLQNEMTRFIDDNRKDEKARIEAMAEENRQTKMADSVRAEYAAKIKAMSAEFDMKKTMLQADLDRMQSEHENELRKMQAACDTRVKAEKDREAELEAQIADLTEKLANAGSARNEEMQARINELEAEKKNWSDQMDHVVSTHKRSNTISSFLVVALCIAALGIGFMFGAIMNIRKAANIEQDALRIQYEQRVERPEASNNIELPDSTQAIVGGIEG